MLATGWNWPTTAGWCVARNRAKCYRVNDTSFWRMAAMGSDSEPGLSANTVGRTYDLSDAFCKMVTRVILNLENHRMRNMNKIDRMAFAAAMVVSIGIAVLAARWYNIRWEDITKGGFFGFPIFIGMFALAAGVPVYMAIRIFRLRRGR